MMMMSHQRGAALMLLSVLIVMGALSLMFATLGHAYVLRMQRDDARILSAARDTVLGFAIANPVRPGELVFPDRSADGNYDGHGDCVSSFAAIASTHLLGRWPAGLEQGCGTDRTAFGIARIDSSGERLWYAVSRNLTSPSPTLHSGLDTGWLTLRGVGGAIIADDIAFLLFTPGGAVNGQNRTALAGPAAYLDAAAAPLAYDNGDGDEQFIITYGDDFNDRLTYVRKGEFFGAVTQRVAMEIADRVTAFRAAHGSYPFPASTAAGACTTGLAGVEGYYPLSIGDCTNIPSSPAAWFETNWLSTVRYRRIAADEVELRFEGCAGIVYSLRADELRRDHARC